MDRRRARGGADRAEAEAEAEPGGYRRKAADGPASCSPRGSTPGKIDGAALLAELEGFVRRFVVFPSAAASRAVALWALHTHALEAAEATPYLGIVARLSAAARAGSRRSSSSSPAGRGRSTASPEATLFRKIERAADDPARRGRRAVGGGDVRTEPLRAIFNAATAAAHDPALRRRGQEQEVHASRSSPARRSPGSGRAVGRTRCSTAAFLIQLRRRARASSLERLRVRKVAPEAELLARRRPPGPRPTWSSSPAPSPTCPRSSTTARRTGRSRCSRSPTSPGASGPSSPARRCSNSRRPRGRGRRLGNPAARRHPRRVRRATTGYRRRAARATARRTRSDPGRRGARAKAGSPRGRWRACCVISESSRSRLSRRREPPRLRARLLRGRLEPLSPRFGRLKC